MTTPLISIVVPCYNQAQYLSETVDSIVNQSISNWECILVNDGSTDDTELLAHQIVKKDARFSYYQQTNQGPSAARNLGISKAQGIFILPLDADDKLSQGFLEEALSIFELDPQVKLVYPRVIRFGRKNGEWTKLSAYSFENLLHASMLVSSSVYRKEDFRKTKGYNINMKFGLEDWDFWLSFLNKEDKVVRMENNFLYYRTKQKSRQSEINQNKELHHKAKTQLFENHITLYENQEDYLKFIKNRDQPRGRFAKLLKRFQR